MRDLVSTRWVRLVGVIAFLSIVGAVLVPFGFPWTVWVSLLCVSLALTGAFFVRGRSPRSIHQMLADVEGEPVRAVAPPAEVVQGARSRPRN